MFELWVNRKPKYWVVHQHVDAAMADAMGRNGWEFAGQFATERLMVRAVLASYRAFARVMPERSLTRLDRREL
jgi:hypothetical protein